MWKNGQIVELTNSVGCTCALGSKAIIIDTGPKDTFGVDMIKVEWVRPLTCSPEFADMNDGISEQMDGSYPITWFKPLITKTRYDLIIRYNLIL